MWGGIINMMHQVLPEKEVLPLAAASRDQLTGKWNRTELGTQLAGWPAGRLAQAGLVCKCMCGSGSGEAGVGVTSMGFLEGNKMRARG